MTGTPTEPIVDETSTPVEEATTPPDPNLGKWVMYEDQACKVIAVNPETGAFLLARPGLPNVEVEELPDELPESRWQDLDNASNMFDALFRITTHAEAICPLDQDIGSASVLGIYVLLRDLIQLLVQITSQQNQLAVKTHNQLQEISKFLFAFRPSAEQTIEEKAKALGIEPLPPPVQ